MEELAFSKRQRCSEEEYKPINPHASKYFTTQQIRSLFTKSGLASLREQQQRQQLNGAAPEEPQPDPLAAWLEDRGLSHLAPLLAQEEVDLSSLPLLEPWDLAGLAMAPEDVARLLEAVKLHPPGQATDGDAGDADGGGMYDTAAHRHLELAVSDMSARGGARAEPQYQGGMNDGGNNSNMNNMSNWGTAANSARVDSRITDYFAQPAGAARPREAAGSAAGPPSTSGGAGSAAARPRTFWQPRATPKAPSQCHVIPNTTFVVDGFDRDTSALGTRSFFLSHFHADHYKGLSGKWAKGIIYCTPVTARLANQRLKVRQEFLRPCPLGTPITVEGTRVTFLDANHCPGAAMMVFDRPGLPPVLHTGDFRFHPSMMSIAALAPLRGRCRLVLDTTYCSPEYDFPAQDLVVKQVVEAVKAEEFNTNSAANAGTLFLFGTYTIGKERIFMEVAKALKRPVYVGSAKMDIMKCLDLCPEERSLLTDDECQTNLHVAPLWSVQMKRMKSLLQHYRGRFTTAIGFQPTGWTATKGTGAGKGGGTSGAASSAPLHKSTNKDRGNGTLIVYSVPYSEHSSFSELRAFVHFLRPQSVVPHVNADGAYGPKTQRMLELLGAPLEGTKAAELLAAGQAPQPQGVGAGSAGPAT